MTLSQRLTRAGLTFILFGTVAAVLPQQSGAARADVCTIGGHTYAIYQSGSSTTSPTYHQSVGSAVAYTAALDTPGNVQGTITGIPVGGATVVPNPGNPVTVTTPVAGDGASLSATYTSGATTYTATATVASP